MKLKFINLLLATGLLIGSAQVFTSCKDNESDLVADLTADADKAHKQLSDRIDQNEQELKNLESNLKGMISALEAKLDQKEQELKNAIKANDDAIKAAKDDIEANKKAIEDNKKAIAGLTTEVAGIKADIDLIKEQIEKINTTLDTLKNVNDTLEDYGKRITLLETTMLEVQSTLKYLNNSIESIQKDIEKLQGADANLQTQIDDLKSFKDSWSSLLPEIQKNASDALAKAKANETTLAELQKAVEANTNKNNDLQKQIDDLVAAGGDYASLDEIYDIQKKLLAEIDDKYSSSIAYTQLMCTALGVELENQGNKLNNLENAYNVKVEEFEQQLENLVMNSDAAMDQLKDELASQHRLWDELYHQFMDFKDAFNEFKEGLPDLIAQITSVDGTIAKLTNRVEDIANRIYGIEIQKVKNPVIGSLTTPLGVNSNILMTLVGGAPRFSFPATANGFTYNGKATALTSADLALISKVCGTAPSTAIKNNVDMYLKAANGEAYMGEVYMTVNPSNIDLEKFTFDLVKSNGEVVPVNMALAPCDEVLTFGYSRSQANGFYSTPATVPADQLSAVRFVFNKELQDKIDNILSNPSQLKSAGTIVSLAKAVLGQVNNTIPALGVQASWSEENGDVTENHTVTSKYDIAAAAVTPLSYEFLANMTDKFNKIPHLPDLAIFKNKFNSWYDTMTGNIHIDLGKANVTIEHAQIDGNFTIVITGLDEVMVAIPSIGVDLDGDNVVDAWTVPEVVPLDLSNLKAPIETAIKDAVGKITDELQSNVDQLIDNLAKQIQDVFNDMTVTVNDQLADILADIQKQVGMNIDAITNRISGYYDKVQSLIDRLNNVLADPNYYLRPALMYNVGGEMGQLSQVPALPSQFALASGNAIMLVATSPTAEIVAPAYQKYVAVTNVYSVADSKKSAANGDATAAKLMKAANAQQYMNEVISGQIKTIPLTLDGAKGYCFEIVYQAVDYNGKVADSKYYLIVK